MNYFDLPKAEENEVPEDKSPILTVDNLAVSINGKANSNRLIQDISFKLHPGETLAIAGESGSGKSITSLAIMGLLPPPAVQVSEGEIWLADTELTQCSESELREIRGYRVAMIFQEPMTSLNPVITIGIQISEAIRAHIPVSLEEAQTRAMEALRSVRISQPEQPEMGQYPHEFSGGMRQRVMIAMALAMEPEILIADEPTTALDVTVQREILDLLRELQAEHGTAILLISHDMGVIAEMADRIIVMNNGQIVEENDTKSLFAAPSKPYTKKLLAAVPRIGDVNRDNTPFVYEQFVARIKNVSVQYKIRGGLLGRVTHKVHAVENVSFNIKMGETFAVVGESGSGKSTLAKALVGLVPYRGAIAITGPIVGPLDTAQRKAHSRNVQIVFQDPMAALNPRMRIGELIAEPLVIHRIGTPSERKEATQKLLDRVGLPTDCLDRYPHQFSGGQRQRICIARALTLQPKLIIADESVSALDVSVQAQVLELLAELKHELSISYLFISHDMAVVENIADRVAVMYLGQIVELGTRKQIFGNPQHDYTKRLIDAVPIPDPLHVRPPSDRVRPKLPNPVLKVGQFPKRVELEDIGAGHLVAQ